MSPAQLEFGIERRHHAQPRAIPRTRMERRDLVMDIVEDRRLPMFVCIVQRNHSPEILMLCQFNSRRAAVLAGEQFMSDYFRRERQANIQAA